jgi:hypothetical protein
MVWLDPALTPPSRLDLPTGHHLRPIRELDVGIDYRAVMGSRRRLWEKYGDAWGWPPATMSYEDDREDLARHEAEAVARAAFNYAILDEAEGRLFGCVYIDPPEAGAPSGSDAMASWWIVDEALGSPLEGALDDVVPSWLADVWGFRTVHYHP